MLYRQKLIYRKTIAFEWLLFRFLFGEIAFDNLAIFPARGKVKNNNSFRFLLSGKRKKLFFQYMKSLFTLALYHCTVHT